MDLHTLYWLIASPFILIVALVLIALCFCAALILFDRWLVTPVSNLIDRLSNRRDPNG